MKGRGKFRMISSLISPGNAFDTAHVDTCHLHSDDGLYIGSCFSNIFLISGERSVDFAFQMIQQVANGQIGFPYQGKVQTGIRAHRLHRNGSDMRAKSDRFGTARVSQETAIHIVLKRGCGQLRQIILGLVLIQQLGELCPAHALGIAVHHLHLVSWMQQARPFVPGKPAARPCFRACAVPHGAGYGSRVHRPAWAG